MKMKLAAKTRCELDTLLQSKSRTELIDLIFRLTTFERLLTAREIAEASHMSKRDVLRDMKAGCFEDPIFGRGFFCRAANSLRVSASAANAWRGSFFVSVEQKNEMESQPVSKEQRKTGREAGELRQRLG